MAKKPKELPLNVKRIQQLRTRCIPYSTEELKVMKARAEAKRNPAALIAQGTHRRFPILTHKP